MPVTRSDAIEESDLLEVPDHWAYDDAARGEVARCARQLGITLRDAETFQEIFGVERLHHFPGTQEQAERRLQQWAITREIELIDKMHFDEPVHTEAKAIAWTNILTPDGVQINITAREGASADRVTATVLALTGAMRTLKDLGFVTRKTR